jgi:hypothetical protein
LLKVRFLTYESIVFEAEFGVLAFAAVAGTSNSRYTEFVTWCRCSNARPIRSKYADRKRSCDGRNAASSWHASRVPQSSALARATRAAWHSAPTTRQRSGPLGWRRASWWF